MTPTKSSKQTHLSSKKPDITTLRIFVVTDVAAMVLAIRVMVKVKMPAVSFSPISYYQDPVQYDSRMPSIKCVAKSAL